MPEYDWLTEEDFKNKVVARAHEAAGELGYTIDKSVTVFLLFVLNKYHKENQKAEQGKSLWDSRSPKDALASVDTLIREAGNFATARNSGTIALPDITNAHTSKFCSVWPFCGKKKSSGFIFNI